MGSRGPRPTPSATLRRRGSWRADLNPSEPRPDPARPREPEWLSANARRVWRELCPQLHTMGVLTRVDRGELALYCSAFATWRQLQAVIDERGTVVVIRGPSPGKYPRGHAQAGQPIPGPVKEIRPLPQAKQAIHLLQVLSRLGGGLGLNPAGRARLTANVPIDPPDEAGKARFFDDARTA